MAKTQEPRTVSGEEYQTMRQAAATPGRQVTVQSRWLGLGMAAVVLCALSFWGGITYQEHHGKTTMLTGNSNGFGGGFSRQSGMRRLGAIGQVTAVSSTSITVDNQRTGSSSTYSITSATTISDNGQGATASDIQTGATVVIIPTSSGSTTAGRILVNPSFGGGFGGGANPMGSGAVN